MAFIFTTLTLNSQTSVSRFGCGFGFEQKYWRIESTGLVKKKHNPLPPPPPPNVSNYIKLAFQDYCISSISNPLNPLEWISFSRND